MKELIIIGVALLMTGVDCSGSKTNTVDQQSNSYRSAALNFAKLTPVEQINTFHNLIKKEVASPTKPRKGFGGGMITHEFQLKQFEKGLFNVLAKRTNEGRSLASPHVVHSVRALVKAEENPEVKQVYTRVLERFERLKKARDESIEKTAYMEAELDNWNPNPKELEKPEQSIMAPDIQIEGTWLTQGGFHHAKLRLSRTNRTLVAKFSSNSGHPISTNLDRTGVLTNGVLTLNRPVKEYSIQPYKTLYAIRVEGVDYLASSPKVSNINKKLESRRQAGLSPAVSRLDVYRKEKPALYPESCKSVVISGCATVFEDPLQNLLGVWQLTKVSKLDPQDSGFVENIKFIFQPDGKLYKMRPTEDEFSKRKLYGYRVEGERMIRTKPWQKDTQETFSLREDSLIIAHPGGPRFHFKKRSADHSAIPLWKSKWISYTVNHDQMMPPVNSEIDKQTLTSLEPMSLATTQAMGSGQVGGIGDDESNVIIFKDRDIDGLPAYSIYRGAYDGMTKKEALSILNAIEEGLHEQWKTEVTSSVVPPEGAHSNAQ